MKNKKAIALLLALSLLVILIGLSAALLTRSISEGGSSRSSTRRSQAFWLAEAGLQRALWELNHGDGNWSGWAALPISLSFTLTGVGEYSVVITNADGNSPTITSTGFIPSASATDHVERSITLTVNKNTKNPFSYAGFGKSSVVAAGNSLFDSYDSSLGAYGGTNIGTNANIGTNGSSAGAIDINDNTVVNGGASTGPGGTVTIDPTATINGTVSDNCSEILPRIRIPADASTAPSGGDYTVSSPQSLSAGTYQFSSISVSGKGVLTTTGPVTLYVTGDLSVAGTGSIVVNDQTTIYVDGKIYLAGNGITNTTQTPSNLLMFSTSTNTLDGVYIAGNAAFYGAVYAPNASVEIAGNGQAFGAFVADALYVPGNGQIHYDEALTVISVESLATYSSAQWQDQNNPYPVAP